MSSPAVICTEIHAKLYVSWSRLRLYRAALRSNGHARIHTAIILHNFHCYLAGIQIGLLQRAIPSPAILVRTPKEVKRLHPITLLLGEV